MIENRNTFILQKINEEGKVSITELANELNVSEMTIRRDLMELEAEHLLKRVYGGAISASGRSYEPPLMIRSESEIEAKVNIGKFAASLVEDGDSLAIDIGSTTYEVAKNLTAKKNLTIITPGLYIANLFLNKPDIRTILPGGIIRHGEGSLTGQLTTQAFSSLRFNFFLYRLKFLRTMLSYNFCVSLILAKWTNFGVSFKIICDCW